MDTLTLVFFAISLPKGIFSHSEMPASLDLEADQNDRNMIRTDIRILAIVNYGGHLLPLGPQCPEGMLLALNASRNYALHNANASQAAKHFYHKYNLSIDLEDDNCSQLVGLSAGMRRLMNSFNSNNTVPLVLTSPCAVGTRLGQFLHHLNFAGLTMAAPTDDIYRDRNKYDSFYAIAGSAGQSLQSVAFARFFRVHGWKKVTLLSETNPMWIPFEQVFSQEMEAANISLIGVVKVPFNAGDRVETAILQDAMEELIFLDARIIVVVSNIPSDVFCWLHRYNVYGPSYVIMLSHLSLLQREQSPHYPWCSTSMISDVLASVIFFDNSQYTSGFSNASVDDLGLTANALEKELSANIGAQVKTVVTTNLKFMRTLCYDQVLTAIRVLQETEQSLIQNRNQSLVDWFTNGIKFNDQDVAQGFRTAVKESLHRVAFRGLGVQVDLGKQDNGTNYIVGSFMQYATPEELVTVATFVNKSITLGPNMIQWRTAGNLAPPDSMRVIVVQQRDIPLPVAVILSTGSFLFVIVETALIVLFVVITLGKMRRLRLTGSEPRLKITILLGNILLNVHNLCFPIFDNKIGPETAAFYCRFCDWFLCVGFTLTLTSLSGFMELASLQLLLQRRRVYLRAWMDRVAGAGTTPQWWRYIERTALAHLALKRRTRSLFVIGYVLICTLLSAAIVTVTFTYKAQLSATSIMTGDESFDGPNKGLGISYRTFVVRCEYQSIPRNATNIIATTWLSLHFVVIIRAIGLAFLLYRKRVPFMTDIGKISTATICEIFTMVLLGAVAVMVYANVTHRYLQLSFSVVILAISAINLTFTTTSFAKGIPQRAPRP